MSKSITRMIRMMKEWDEVVLAARGEVEGKGALDVGVSEEVIGGVEEGVAVVGDEVEEEGVVIGAVVVGGSVGGVGGKEVCVGLVVSSVTVAGGNDDVWGGVEVDDCNEEVWASVEVTDVIVGTGVVRRGVVKGGSVCARVDNFIDPTQRAPFKSKNIAPLQ
jgi:hypothetical protein